MSIFPYARINLISSESRDMIGYALESAHILSGPVLQNVIKCIDLWMD